MTNKDFKEGMEVSCEIGNLTYKGKFESATWHIHLDNGNVVLASSVDNIKPIQPKHRTIDDLECGDYVVGKYGKKLCLAICGKLYGMSYNNDFETLEGWFTLKNLMEMEYTLYQPEEVKETDIDEVTLDKCIKVVEEYFSSGELSNTKKELLQALKNLKK